MSRWQWRSGATVLLVIRAGGATAQCDPLETAKLLASDGAASDQFGAAVAISGDVAIVGARHDGDFGALSGSAYIFRRHESGDWVEIATLTASDAHAGQQFGWNVDIEDDLAVIGAPGDDSLAFQAGAVYVFRHIGSDQWVEIEKLTASDGQAWDTFGYSVAISDDHLIVGALWDDDLGAQSGSAYIFREDKSGNWIESDKINASDGAIEDYFGLDVAIDGDTAIVAAPRDDDLGSQSGSAYIFRDNGAGNWIQIDKLNASDGGADDDFGYQVSISGDIAMASAPDADSSDGAVYVFRDDGAGDWTQSAKITASDFQINQQFGASVEVRDGHAVIGTFRSSAYFFLSAGPTQWVEIKKVTASDGWLGDQFGFSADLSGEHAIIGAFRDDDNGSESGSAYIFELNCETSIPATLTDFTIAFGSLISGGLPDLMESDDSYVRARSRIGFTASEPNVMDLRVGAVTEAEDPQSLDLTVEGRLNQSGGVSKLRLRNWATNAFQQVHQYSIGATEIVETIENVPALNRVRASDGRIELSIRQSAVATFSITGFISSTDQVVIGVR